MSLGAPTSRTTLTCSAMVGRSSGISQRSCHDDDVRGGAGAQQIARLPLLHMEHRRAHAVRGKEKEEEDAGGGIDDFDDKGGEENGFAMTQPARALALLV